MKKENKNGKQGSLLKFLIISFGLFNTAIFLALFGVSIISSIIANYMTFSPDIKGFLNKVTELKEEEFTQLNVKKYFGKNGEFIIINQSGSVIYASNPYSYSDFLDSELECIPAYDSDYRITVEELPNSLPNGRFLLTKERYRTEGEWEEEGYLFLDKGLKVVSGTLFPKRIYFTRQEFQYLQGLDKKGRTIIKQSYENKEGQKRTLLYTTQPVDAFQYKNALMLESRIPWIIMPINLILALIYVCWLVGRNKQFMDPLNQAMINFSNGVPIHLECYSGPDEFVDFAHNFCHLEKQFIKSEWERKRLDSSRQQLLTDISHDLKTPITIIQGYAGALRDGVVPTEEYSQYLDTIFKKSEKMAELLSLFHEYSKLEHPEMPITLKNLDICDIIQSYFSDRYQELELLGFEIEADIPDSAIICAIDQELFCRVMENLVNNVIKYNPIGTCIFVRVRQKLKQVQIIIGDNGVGIPKELRTTLFEAFVTGDPARGKEHGSGLGLAITKKIIQLHHGQIMLSQKEKLNCCTEFLITLPKI